MRIRARYFVIFSAMTVLCGVVLAYGTLSQPQTTSQISNNSSANKEIVNLYNELITVQQKAVEHEKYLIELGQGDLIELAQAEAIASEARIQLAQFRDNKKAVIEELQNLIQKVTEIRNSLKRDADIGMRTQSWTFVVDPIILEAKIRLAKLRYGTPELTQSQDYKSELRLRLEAAQRINDIRVRNEALANIANTAADLGETEVVKDSLRQINDLRLRNQTVGTCALNLAKAGKTQDAIALAGTINDLQFKNKILLRIATPGEE